MNLFINLYRDKNPARQKELEEALSMNLLNQKIKTIYAVVEKLSEWVDLIGSDRIVLIKSEQRPTYNDYFKLINEYAQEDTVSAIANSDIYFAQEGVVLITENIRHNECYALTRWDKLTGCEVKHFCRPDSQDCWIFKGKVKPVQNCEFTLGKPGCDNKIAYQLERAGYKILNPSKDIVTYHLHNSNIRNYEIGAGSADRLLPPYKLIHPHNLEKLNWISEIKNLKGNNLQSQYSEDIIIHHIFKNIGTANKFFVDLGAGAYDGKMSNTRTLKHNGWSGFGVDCENFNDEWILCRFIKPSNVCEILISQKTPKYFDFLNLDLDSSDYWVLKELLKEYSPRVICCEFNGTLNPNIPVALEYEDGYTWDKTNKYGYSFAAGKKLLEQHGYEIIYNLHDTNIFAVKKELVEGIDFVPVIAQKNIYHPINSNAKWIGV